MEPRVLGLFIGTTSFNLFYDGTCDEMPHLRYFFSDSPADKARAGRPDVVPHSILGGS